MPNPKDGSAPHRSGLYLGDEQRAQVVADYHMMGAKLTYSSWGIPRRTMYRYVKLARTNPEFGAKVQKCLDSLNDRVNAERANLRLTTLRALRTQLAKGTGKLDEYTNAAVAVAKLTGTHEGDKQAYAARAPVINSSGGGPGVALAVPLILTTTRPDVSNPQPVNPPPADE